MQNKFVLFVFARTFVRGFGTYLGQVYKLGDPLACFCQESLYNSLYFITIFVKTLFSSGSSLIFIFKRHALQQGKTVDNTKICPTISQKPLPTYFWSIRMKKDFEKGILSTSCMKVCNRCYKISISGLSFNKSIENLIRIGMN